MFFTITFLLVFPIFQCTQIQINFTDTEGSNSVSLICRIYSDKSQDLLKKNYKILWQGSQFNKEAQKKLVEEIDMGLVPGISIKASNQSVCYVLSPKETNSRISSNRKRISREVASLPAENGVCQPGYRLDNNRCFECSPGSYSSGQDRQCFLCPKDFFMTKSGADSCWPCPDGRKTIGMGSNSEDSCLYFDETGNPIPKVDWTLILSLVGVLLLLIWFPLIYLMYRCLTEDPEKGTKGKKVDLRQKKPLFSRKKSDEHTYESISNLGSSDENDHIYAEIGDYDDILYDDVQEPVKKGEQRKLVTGQSKQTKKQKEVRKQKGTKSEVESDENDYEVPRRKNVENDYEVPRQKSKKRISKKTGSTILSICEIRSPQDTKNVPLRKLSSKRSFVKLKTVEKDLSSDDDNFNGEKMMSKQND